MRLGGLTRRLVAPYKNWKPWFHKFEVSPSVNLNLGSVCLGRNLNLPFLSCLPTLASPERWTCSHPWTYGICHDQADVDHHWVPGTQTTWCHIMLKTYKHVFEYRYIDVIYMLNVLAWCQWNHWSVHHKPLPKFIGSNPFLWYRS